MIGIAKRTGKISEATILTTILLDVEEDCTTTVAKRPIIRPAKGFVSTTLLRNASDAYRPAIRGNDELIKLSDTTKKYKHVNRPPSLRAINPYLISGFGPLSLGFLSFFLS